MEQEYDNQAPAMPYYPDTSGRADLLDKINPDKFTIWDIADAGIRGINKLIGWKMELDKEFNDDGDLIALGFDSNTISLYHTMNK